MGLPENKQRKLGWYWIKYSKRKQWAYYGGGEYRPWQIVDCEVGIHDDSKIEVLKGPVSESDIDNAYFGYWA